MVDETTGDVHVPGTRDAKRKSTQDEANYRKAGEGDKSCATCRFFRDDACQLVDGEVTAGGVCDRWGERGRRAVRIQKGADSVLMFPIVKYKRGDWRNFTRENAEEMVRNFDANVLERRNGWLPVNREHERKEGRIGYITDLWVADDGVRAKVAPAQGHEGEMDDFDYISPEINWEWDNPYDGKTYRNVLFGAGVTNYPFLLGRTTLHSVQIWKSDGWEPITLDAMVDADLFALRDRLQEQGPCPTT